MSSIISTAWLFPGQGSQEVGMGRALLETYPPANVILDLAEKFSGLPLKQICQRGPESTLVQTNYLQPSLVALSVAFVDFLKSHGLEPTFVAGHSLGELSALYAAGVLDVSDVIRLATERGRLMAQAATGGMLAVKDLDSSVIEQVLAEHKEGIIVAANYNAPQQLVVSGESNALETVAQKLTLMGGTCVRLNVQGAWHSPLVTDAAEAFKTHIDCATFNAPKCKLLMGMTADYEDNPERIRAILKSQICSPVRWYEVIQKIERSGTNRFLEVGSGKVLKGLMRKIFADPKSYEIAGTDSSRFLKDIVNNGASK